MKTTVVISTYSINNIDLVIKCIDSVEKQTLPPDEILLILDDDSDLLNYYDKNIEADVKIFSSGGYGLSIARNTGVKKARGEVVFFIDDDAIADENWLKNQLIHYLDPNVVGVGGFVKADFEDKRPFWFPEELDWVVGCTYRGHPEERCSIRNPIGCNMSFRKDVVALVGYFNVNLGRSGRTLISAEETELSVRILDAVPNSKIIYDPSTVVYHKVPSTRLNVKYIMKRAYQEGVSKSIMQYDDKTNDIKKENEYLKFLLMKAIPLRLKKIYMLKELSQLFIIMVVIFMVGLGYLTSRFAK